MKKLLISPSILSSDFGNLREEIKRVERCNIDSIHIDVMDGIFVPNITIGPVVIASVRNSTKIPFETHLMIRHPDRYIKSFAQAGSDMIIVHCESDHNIKKTIKAIRSYGKKAGISINPETDFDSVKKYMQYVDLLLVMSVHPGFGGQKFIPSTLKKIKRASDYIKKNRYKVRIAIDGGINLETGKSAVAAGADELIAGSAIFNSKSISKTIKEFRLLER